ncbi:Uncharacterised protein [uncultured archaeon]|nr:Uncharacterised protein [uncultured archaeon]
MVTNEEFQSFFNQAFSNLKNFYIKSHSLKNDDEISPNERALKIAISSLPCAIKFIELKIDPGEHKNVKDESCYLIRYDLTKFQDNSVEFIGQFGIEDEASLVQIISGNFGLDEEDAKHYISDLTKEFNVIGTSYDYFYIQFTPFNILKRPNEFANSLIDIFIIFLADELIKLFKNEVEIDFKNLYNLKKDTILPFSEFVAKDKIIEGLVKIEGGKPSILSVEDFQSDVADIQLIPTVPEHVRRVFNCAKELYIFGYFKYCFFTVSNHYAYLALESAIKNKYNKWLGNKAILINKMGDSIEMASPTYRKIQEFCSKDRKNWRCDQITVNGEPFPFSMKKLLDWLVSKGIIGMWEKNMFDAGIYLRNSLSHLEFAPILFPSSHTLKNIAQDINKLYHKQLRPPEL